MKYLGLDYGAKRVGVAISNAEGTIAFPRATLESGPLLMKVLRDLVVDEHIEAIVIGDTRTLEGAENPVTQAAEKFTRSLQEATGLQVHAAREAGSSIAVSDASGKSHDDAAAAAFILQRYLDGVH